MATAEPTLIDVQPITVDEPPAPPPVRQPGWRLLTRIAFRFAFVWFVLYNLPFPLGQIPFTGAVANLWQRLWNAIVPWVGSQVLRLPEPITILPAGSGDTTWNYVQLLCFAIIAAVATLVWSVLDRRRVAYPRLHDWLRVYLRFPLGVTMISYGAFKVIKSQFPFPALASLAVPYGESSPMGLLWRMMGYSTAFSVFVGLGELVGGVLLFFRRTTTVGALLLVAVLSNVVMMNFAFDVPVKLYSSNLLLMAIVLLLPESRRLLNVLVLGRAAGAVQLRPLVRGRRWQVAGHVARLLLLGVALTGSFRQSWRAHGFGDGAETTPLYGIYEAEEFTRAGQPLPPLITDSTRWRRLFIDRGDRLAIQTMNDQLRRFAGRHDTAGATLAFMAGSDTTVLALRQPDSAHVLLSGVMNGDSIRVLLRRRDPSELLLVGRGFRWINERPFNR